MTLKKEGDDNDDDSILFVVVVVVVDIKRARAREREFEHTNKRSSAYHFARIETMTLLRRYVWFWHCVEQKTTMAIYLSLALSLVSLHDKNIALRHLCGLFLFVSNHHDVMCVILLRDPLLLVGLFFTQDACIPLILILSFAVSFFSFWVSSATIRQCTRLYARCLSSSATASASSSSSSVDERLYQAALEHVPRHGWTEETIVAAIETTRLPLSMAGRLTPIQLVEKFMDECNQRYQQDNLALDNNTNTTNMTLPQRLFVALQARLRYVLPVLSQWHQGMALGMTLAPTTTQRQLHELVRLVSAKAIEGTDHTPLTTVQQTAVGAVYVATELHLLTDTSPNQQETWQFLQERIHDLDLMAQLQQSDSLLSTHSAVAASAVASSLLGAAISLAQPAAQQVANTAATTVVPSILSLLQPQDNHNASSAPPGTRPDDYEDLPPFPKT